MKTKKSNTANLENKKGIFFLIGLIISLGLVLLAFEWKTAPNSNKTGFVMQKVVHEDFGTYIPPTKEKPKELPKPKIEAQLIEIVDNNTDVSDDPGIFNTDPADEIEYDFIKIVISSVQEEKEEEIFVFVEEMPEFPGGEKALLTFLSNSVKYPAIAQENGIQGKVYVSFIIDETGNVYNAQIIRGVDVSLDNEALRVVRLMPKWKPGKQGNNAVKVRYSVPINFELR